MALFFAVRAELDETRHDSPLADADDLCIEFRRSLRHLGVRVLPIRLSRNPDGYVFGTASREPLRCNLVPRVLRDELPDYIDRISDEAPSPEGPFTWPTQPSQ